MGIGIQGKAAVGKDAGLRLRLRRGGGILGGAPGQADPPPQGLYPEHQFLIIKGLGDIVIRPQLQPQDLAGALVVGGDEDHGGRPVQLLDRPENVVAIHIRQHNVQKDDIRLLGGISVHRLPAGISADRVVALQLQVHPDQIDDTGLVIHDQNLHFRSPLTE